MNRLMEFLLSLPVWLVETIHRDTEKMLATEHSMPVKAFAATWYFCWWFAVVYFAIHVPGYVVEATRFIGGAL